MAAKKRRRKNRKDEKSVGWVVGMVMLLVALFGWAVAAADYAKAVEEWEPGESVSMDEKTAGPRTMRVKFAAKLVDGLLDFLENAIVQIPNVFSVAAHAVRHRWGLLLAVVVIELGVLGAGIGLRRLERRLEAERRRNAP